MKKVIILFCVIGFILLFFSCQKEYSYEGGPAASEPQSLNYILEGAPDSCFGFKLNGNYSQGLALTADNTVSVMADVFIPGPFVIKTDTLDGISFSKSGTFTSTGSQEVLLQGKGKPVNQGTFTFKPNSVFSSCTFDVTVTKTEPPSSYHLGANEDGTCSSYLTPGAFYHGTPLNNNIIVVSVSVDAPGDFNITTNTLNGITFSRTGKFTATGQQNVQLIGRGTPVEIGVFVFTPYVIVDGSRIGKGCNMDIYVF